MKQQIIIIKVKFDENSQSPKNWNWSELIGCERDCVEVLNYGVVEDVGEGQIYE